MNRDEQFTTTEKYEPLILNYKIQLCSDNLGGYLRNDINQNEEIYLEIVDAFSHWLHIAFSALPSFQEKEHLDYLRELNKQILHNGKVNFVV